MHTCKQAELKWRESTSTENCGNLWENTGTLGSYWRRRGRPSGQGVSDPSKQEARERERETQYTPYPVLAILERVANVVTMP